MDWTIAAAVLAFSSAPLPTLSAQSHHTLGIIAGKATDARGAAMSDVEIEILDAHRSVRTGSNGLFRIDSLEAGNHLISARHIGFSPLVSPIAIDSVEITYADIVLQPAANVLASVIVKADLLMRGVPRGFLERMHSGGQGTYITAADIQRQNPLRVSDVLRGVPGVKVSGNGEVFTSRGAVTILSNGCANGLPVYLDNVQVGGGTGGSPDGFIGDLNAGRVSRGAPQLAGSTAAARSIADIVPPERVVAIEVYSGPASVPPTLPAANSSCGAVFIWTR
jgi:hypothetical protein